MAGISINSSVAALGVLRRLDQSSKTVSTAFERLSTALSNLQTTRDGYIDAGSRITDADIATESSALVRAQILQQAGSVVLAQANLIPELALALLAPPRK